MTGGGITIRQMQDVLHRRLEQVGEQDGLRALNLIQVLIGGLEDSISARVLDARRQRRSWAEIGAALGVSKQAAHTRFRELDAQVEAERRAQRESGTPEAPQPQDRAGGAATPPEAAPYGPTTPPPATGGADEAAMTDAEQIRALEELRARLGSRPESEQARLGREEMERRERRKEEKRQAVMEANLDYQRKRAREWEETHASRREAGAR